MHAELAALTDKQSKAGRVDAELQGAALTSKAGMLSPLVTGYKFRQCKLKKMEVLVCVCVCLFLFCHIVLGVVTL